MNEENTTLERVIEIFQEYSSANATLDCLGSYLCHLQRVYAKNAMESDFKYTTSLEGCIISISDVLALIGWRSDSEAQMIFDKYAAKQKEQEKANENTV